MLGEERVWVVGIWLGHNRFLRHLRCSGTANFKCKLENNGDGRELGEVNESRDSALLTLLYSNRFGQT